MISRSSQRGGLFGAWKRTWPTGVLLGLLKCSHEGGELDKFYLKAGFLHVLWFQTTRHPKILVFFFFFLLSLFIKDLIFFEITFKVVIDSIFPPEFLLNRSLVSEVLWKELIISVYWEGVTAGWFLKTLHDFFIISGDRQEIIFSILLLWASQAQHRGRHENDMSFSPSKEVTSLFPWCHVGLHPTGLQTLCLPASRTKKEPRGSNRDINVLTEGGILQLRSWTDTPLCKADSWQDMAAVYAPRGRGGYQL